MQGIPQTFPNLVERYRPDEAVIACTESVFFADNQYPPERRKVLHKSRLNLLYRRVRRNTP